LGSDHKQAQHIALCRGAAKIQNKQWGSIITWASNEPPYLPSPLEMYNDLILSYQAGAKYLIVFNYPQLNAYGALTEEHFKNIENFWKYIQNEKKNFDKTPSSIAYVLPKDFGWGMRHPYDKIWGLWPSDDNSTAIGAMVGGLIDEYDVQMDIIYDDANFDFTDKYSKLYFWNGSITGSSKQLTALSPETQYILLTCISGIVASVFIIYKLKRKTQLKTH